VEELRKMGSNFKILDGSTAIITGVEKYVGAELDAPDLRAGAALVIAGLAADGYTTINQIGFIQRGYERFEEKLQGLGGRIKKVDSDEEVNRFIFSNGNM
jgi:UDP-N-acetylglucosamine 1-carboxyvinyltransferase